MKRFLQKLNLIFRSKPRQRGIFGTPLWAAEYEEAERHFAELRNANSFRCGTFLTRMAAEEAENSAPMHLMPEAMKDQQNEQTQPEAKK